MTLSQSELVLELQQQRSYSWDELRSQLKLELQSSEHILTYGTIGSCNVAHDIDTIVTMKPGSSSANFFRELHGLFDRLDKYLHDNHNARLVRTSRFSDEEETKFIAGCNTNDLVFQVLSYVSLKQIKMHWYDSFNNVDSQQETEKLLKESYQCITGNTSDLFTPEFASYQYEEHFIRLNDSDRINSHFPEDFLVHRMNVLYDFIMRKRLGADFRFAMDEIDCRRLFYDVCGFLDQT